MTYILHGARGSGSAIVEMACAEIGVACEVRDLSLRADEQRSDAYAALNPHRKIPTLQIGDEVLTESAAILLTLDERHPEAALFPPKASEARAQALRYLLFAATELYPIIEIVDYPARFAPAEAVLAVREQATATWRARWQVLERAIGPGPWCVPSGFSGVDLYVALLSRWDLDPAWRAAHLPKVEAVAAQVRERPRVAAVWKRHFPNA